MQKAASIASSALSADRDSARERQEKLYFLIRKRVKRSYLVRRLATVEDVAADIFLLLVDRELPPLESEQLEIMITKTVKQAVRKLIRSDRDMLDVDELGETEHPFYEMDFFSEEKSFEIVFSEFCDSFSEPKRTVFAKSRLLTKENIAELTGLTRREVARMIKSMPTHFEKFYSDFLPESTSGKKIAH